MVIQRTTPKTPGIYTTPYDMSLDGLTYTIGGIDVQLPDHTYPLNSYLVDSSGNPVITWSVSFAPKLIPDPVSGVMKYYAHIQIFDETTGAELADGTALDGYKIVIPIVNM